jgi:phospholipid/cholesterol/gamma-HCH transport system substrate-binding protein
MAIMQDEDTRFRHLSRKIGIFVLLALAGIVLTILSIGVQQDVFTPKTRLFFITDSGQDINEGMAVKLSGFNIGRVDKLALTDAAKVRATLAINSTYMKWIRRDSRARLLKEGVIGDTIIEISPGSEKAKVLAKNEEIAFEREMGLGKVIDELYGDLRPLIDDLKRIARRTDELLAGLPATKQKLDAVLTSAAKNLENLEKTTASDLPTVMRRSREVLDESKKVVDSLSQTWPISGKIEPPRAEILPLDSHEGAGKDAAAPP